MSPILYIIILAIIIIFSAVMTVLWRNDKEDLKNLISTSVINFVIIYLAVMSFSLNENVSTLFEGLILLGLVAGILADIFFCYPTQEKQKLVLVAKIVSYFMFLIAIVYITTVTWIYGFALGILLTILASFSDKIFKIDTNKFKWMFPIYAIILGTVWGQCVFQMILGAFTLINLLALIAFTVLLFADLIWLYSIFGKKELKNLQKVYFILFYLSQVIIASLIFFV